MLSAVEAVSSTTELFEAILVEVDLRTLLTSASRVSRHWHSVISASVRLQRILYLLPENETRSARLDAGREKVQNPLLKDIFPAWFENISSFTPRPRPGVNPMHQFPATAMMGYKRFQELPLYAESLESDDNPFLRPEASWRRMLTSQPPCYVISTNTKRGPGASMSKSDGRGNITRRDAGLRMGELYDVTLRHSARHHISGFMVVWPGAGEEGREDLTRHLRRMSGIVPVVSETGLSQLWEKRPDLVVQMLWTKEGRHRPGEMRVGDLQMFWDRCGMKFVSIDDDEAAEEGMSQVLRQIRAHGEMTAQAA